MTRLSFALKLVVTLLAVAVSGMSCEPKKPVTPERPAPRAVAPAPKIDMSDLAGKARDPRRGITPGALEAEGPPPAPPPKKRAEKNKNPES